MTAARIDFLENALKVLEARYLRRDSERRIIETPEERFESVARGVAYAELLLGRPSQARHWEERFRDLLFSLDFLPNTPTLMNAGRPIGQLSACFVLPVEDSMASIFEALKQMALVQRTGGGTKYIHQRDEDFLQAWFQGENYRRQFTDALRDCVAMGNFKYAIYTDKVYESIFREKAKEYRQILRLNQRDKPRDTFYSEVLDLMAAYECGLADAIRQAFSERGRALDAAGSPLPNALTMTPAGTRRRRTTPNGATPWPR